MVSEQLLHFINHIMSINFRNLWFLANLVIIVQTINRIAPSSAFKMYATNFYADPSSGCEIYTNTTNFYGDVTLQFDPERENVFDILRNEADKLRSLLEEINQSSIEKIQEKQETPRDILHEENLFLKELKEYLRQLFRENLKLSSAVQRIEVKAVENRTQIKQNRAQHTLTVRDLNLSYDKYKYIPTTFVTNFLGFLVINMFQNLHEVKGIEATLTQLSDTTKQLESRLTNLEHNVDRNLQATHLLLQLKSSASDLGNLLNSAVRNGNVRQVLLLLEVGANVEFQDAKKNRPVHVAVQNRQPEILGILLEHKANINSQGEYQRTPLHFVGSNGCLKCGTILLENGASLESLDEWRNTPIIHPAMDGFDECVELLLEKGANVNAAQVEGWTGLHFAAHKGHPSTVKLLVENGADVQLKNVNGKTALDLAVDKHHFEIADFLQKLC